MEACHHCKGPHGEHSCPECGEPTCEDCFEPMTQFNAGNALPCLECSGRNERAWYRESEREHAAEEAKKEAAAKRSAAARARYHTPEAYKKRAEARVMRIEEKRRKALESAERLAEVMKSFRF